MGSDRGGRGTAGGRLITFARMRTPYEHLLAMAEHELALADAGRWEELPAAMDERIRATASLPATPPRPARDVLVRLAQVQRQLDARLRVAHSLAGNELAALRRGRGAVRGYQGGGPLDSGSVYSTA